MYYKITLRLTEVVVAGENVVAVDVGAEAVVVGEEVVAIDLGCIFLLGSYLAWFVSLSNAA